MSTPSDNTSAGHPPLLDDVVLHENDLSEQAKSRFSYHGKILSAFELYRQSILRNEHMTHVGRHISFAELDKLHTDCKRVLNYVADHNQILSCDLPAFGPLIIVGLPRTGSTLLHNLLACDPDCRTTLFTDISVKIVPPIPRSDRDEQARRTAAAQSPMEKDPSFVSQRNKINSAHPAFPIDEDYHILRQASFIPFFTLITSTEDFKYDAWLADEANKDYAYAYHDVFLRMLNSVDAPRSHWLLKSPLHSFQLDTLLRHYPNAALIMTHRRLDEVLPSLCSLSWILSTIYLDKATPATRDTVMKQTTQLFDTMIERIIDFRTRQNAALVKSHKTIIDIAYDDLMKEPIVTVRRIYDHFGLVWSEEFEAAMLVWLRDNPQGKLGRHTYSLAEYGLTREDIEKRHSDYIEYFQC
jgi:hypothetical protein